MSPGKCHPEMFLEEGKTHFLGLSIIPSLHKSGQGMVILET